MEKIFLNHSTIEKLAKKLLEKLPFDTIYCYPIPRGGVAAAYMLKAMHPIPNKFKIVSHPGDCNIFIDDIIDSGDTKNKWSSLYPNTPFFALIDRKKEIDIWGNNWIVFPWENEAESSIEDNIKRMLQYIGEDPERGGLIETPKRVAKAWGQWCSGYSKNAKSILKVFEDGAETYDQMITVKDIPIYSHCEHHLAPIFGTCTISYIPNGKIVGLSKLSRVADMFARRLQVQERMTEQIADALWENLDPVGVGVIIKARHLCMESRGICQQGHYTMTTALRGAIKDQPDCKAEFLKLM